MSGEVPVVEPTGPRKRDSWSLKTIVEDVAGRPIEDLQEPGRPVHPYLQAKLNRPTVSSLRTARTDPSGSGVPDELTDDPVAHYSPPLVGALGRSAHGQEHEHHQETIDHLGRIPQHVGPGSPAHPPGPSRRPERIYLHYLLLHLDHLSDTSLTYLGNAVAEELIHRQEHRLKVENAAQTDTKSSEAVNPPPPEERSAPPLAAPSPEGDAP